MSRDSHRDSCCTVGRDMPKPPQPPSQALPRVEPAYRRALHLKLLLVYV